MASVASSSSGCNSSPAPETRKVRSRSVTRITACSWRSARSVRHSLASSTTARSRLPPNSSSFASRRPKSASASAPPPAKPTSTWPLPARRTLWAPLFITVLLFMVTWPSLAIQTRPLRRTSNTVVEAKVSMEAGLYQGHPGRRRRPRAAAARGVARSGAAAGARVRAAVDRKQPLHLDVGVFLGGRERGVPEQLLDRPQVGAALQQVGGEGVPQGVRVDAPGERRLLDPVVEDAPHRAVAQPAAAVIEEDRLLARAAAASASSPAALARAVRPSGPSVQPPHRFPVVQPTSQRRGRRPAERHHALLASLAHDPQHAARQVDRAPVEPDQLADAQAGSVEHLEQRTVAPRQGRGEHGGRPA